MTSNEVIQEVIDKTDMVELVGEFVSLEKSGANYRGLCPFHDEKTPSFMVSPQKHLATCFGCHKSLNPIQFIQEVKNIPFYEALAYVAAKAGVKVDISKRPSNEPDFSKYYSMMNTALSFYTKNMFETAKGRDALAYLEKRGLSKDICEKFGIGLSDDKSDTIYQIFKKLGYLELDMQKTGLVKAYDKGGYHDLFTRRIMFPIYDEKNNLLGYSGRVYKPEDKEQPKYINSPETIIFKKRDNLFNINNAIFEARKKHHFILCEGQMDVIACDRAGHGEAVCSLGTALTPEQAKLMRKTASEVIVMYDSDQAGINASITAIDILKSAGLDVKLVLLSGAKDADEYALKYGVQKLGEFIDSNIISPSEYRFIAAVNQRDLMNDTDFNLAKGEIFKFLANEESQSLIEKYLKKLSELSGISFDAISMDFNSYAKRGKKNIVIPVSGTTKAVKNVPTFDNKYIRCMRRLIGFATLSRDNALYIDDHISLSGFDDVHKNLWLEIIDGYYAYYNEFDQNKFGEMIRDKNDVFEAFKTDLEILSRDSITKYDNDDLVSCIETLNESSLIKKIEELKYKIKHESSKEAQKYFANELFELQRRLKSKTQERK